MMSLERGWSFSEQTLETPSVTVHQDWSTHLYSEMFSGKSCTVSVFSEFLEKPVANFLDLRYDGSIGWQNLNKTLEEIRVWQISTSQGWRTRSIS